MTDCKKLGFQNQGEVLAIIDKDRSYLSRMKRNKHAIYECLMLGAFLVRNGFTIDDGEKLQGLFDYMESKK